MVRSLTNQKARKNGFLSPLGINSAVITEQLTSGRFQSEILIVFLFRKMFPSPSKIVLRSLNSSLMVIFCSPFLLLFDTVLSTSNSLHFQKGKTSKDAVTHRIFKKNRKTHHCFYLNVENLNVYPGKKNLE